MNESASASQTSNASEPASAPQAARAPESSGARRDVLLGGPNEQAMGLARAVRVGNVIAVGGTAAINVDGTNVDADDIEGQARRCYEIVGQALAAAGADASHVVRTRTMLVDVGDYKTALNVRKEFLGDTLAAETIVEVSRFVDPAWQIEIEVDAVIPEGA